ncbi:50S ribosomal protein L25/general stress protein Ctc [Corynebacterium mastitidis]|uniref:Large ribosomal subunit protein bL25 n=1 Tax=Corynebacterium mastitidis TaxID=161890 RepID=A0A2N0XA52_9CORY|nr:50S ribosomal protein L25/general stress protein Ctc [Corynebacterium mastitidis]MCH6197429.1 50S ribosomal protein L25/general stress protein Ctc [Corynebacterium mastitidis]PKF69569.1 50S ribosomal protein L25 [Corynebacterium mastitidis]
MAAKYPTLEAKNRTEFGKGAARRLRRDWQIPGVIYGPELDGVVHFSAPLLDMQALVRNNGVNAIVEMDIEGEKYLTMVKNVDQNVLTLDIDHIDLLAIKRGEKVEVEVPVVLEGEPAAGTMSIQDADVLLVEADVLNIPEEITVSIEGLEVDTKITAGELDLPGDVTLIAEEETVIVSITYPEVDEELEEAAEAAEEGGAEAGAESEESTEEDAE